MRCNQEMLLSEAYRLAMQAFYEAVVEIRPTVGTVRFSEALNKSEIARIASEEARLALETHGREHGC